MPNIILDDARADVSVGGTGADGDLVLKDRAGKARIQVSAAERTAPAEVRVQLDAGAGNITLGGDQRDAEILMRDREGKDRIYIDAGQWAKNRDHRIYLDGSAGNITLGGAGSDGDLYLHDKDGKRRIHLDAGGGEAHDPAATILAQGATGRLTLGGSEHNGTLALRDQANKTRVTMEAQGKLTVLSSKGEEQIQLQTGDLSSGPVPQAVLRLGGHGVNSRIVLMDKANNVLVDLASGDPIVSPSHIPGKIIIDVHKATVELQYTTLIADDVRLRVIGSVTHSLRDLKTKLDALEARVRALERP